MVVTNSHFTRQAKLLAQRNQVEMWSRRELIEELLFSRRACGRRCAYPGA
jgi:HJR/Mrr/RecB family endonuclease